MKTIEELKQSGCIIFECLSGSKAYGLDTAESDTDIRGVFILPKEHYFSLEYIDQINDATNDVVYYELSKFIGLCAKNNPNILELLAVAEEHVVYQHPLFAKLKIGLFLSRKSEQSFGNYAYAQIKKARGLNKKIMNPMAKEKKGVLDFCYIYNGSKSIFFKKYLEENNYSQEFCGLTALPNLKEAYNLYYDETKNYKGVITENSNQLCLSMVDKGIIPNSLLYFNKDGYSAYCKRYKEYWDWIEKRNDARYQTTIAHGKNYDSKNMMHTFRLLNMAKEIALEGKVNVLRSDREFLLKIKKGEFEYDDLVHKAEKLKNDLSEFYSKSNLPDSPDMKLINSLLLEIRDAYYKENETSKSF